MAITKVDLAAKIRRRLGAPIVKVELDDSQIYDAIDYARDKFIKWAVGQSRVETFFTLALSATQTIYELPIGVTDVIEYKDTAGSSSGGINTLFTIDNYLYNHGMYEALYHTAMSGGGYTMISYHIARDFLETVARYTPSKYNWRYHRFTNELEIQPAPPSGSALTIVQSGNTFTIDSPGFVLLRAYMIEGSTHTTGWASGDSDGDFFTSDWIFDYAHAMCMITLGRIRSKFANFTSVGNTGISMDGDTLLSEGLQEKERLDATLKDEENWEGWTIETG